jgi:hypothetical protein
MGCRFLSAITATTRAATDTAPRTKVAKSDGRIPTDAVEVKTVVVFQEVTVLFATVFVKFATVVVKLILVVVTFEGTIFGLALASAAPPCCCERAEICGTKRLPVAKSKIARIENVSLGEFNSLTTRLHLYSDGWLFTTCDFPFR